MKSIGFILFFLLIVFTGCEHDGNGDPTSFNGRVVYSDDQEPFNGEIIISGSKNLLLGEQAIVTKRQNLEEDGSYSLTFEGNEDIDYFLIDLSEVREVGGTDSFVAVDCGDLNCIQVSPGRIYENLVINLERPN